MFGLEVLVGGPQYLASMKGPSRRRGNTAMMAMTTLPSDASMKGPSRRRGNSGRGNRAPTRHYTGRLRAVLKKDGSRVED
ncbi:Protein of unknown function [Propionibacterium freudenreichii]|uniref:hypothetical protein n=1 Tax=Propionibacterium freudenreichii TaxID=1744 RepID=UPI000542D49B|nr:Protein of unknown function [Propionibacterium freudenreichii]